MDIDMDVDDMIEETDSEKIQKFLSTISNSSWLVNINEKIIDDMLCKAASIQKSFANKELSDFTRELSALMPEMNFKNLLDQLIKDILINANVNEDLVVYAIDKYTLLSSKSSFSVVLNMISAEFNLRDSILQILSRTSDGTFKSGNWEEINKLLLNINEVDSVVKNNKVLHFLQANPSVLLQSVIHSVEPNGQILLSEIINCLECQNDLKLWFTLLRKQNINYVLNLSTNYSDFLNAILNFFNKFADEIETNYDEDLNFKYSHLNLDFDEFMELLKLFLNEKKVSKVILKFLEDKILTENKNFLFWADVNACIQI